MRAVVVTLALAIALPASAATLEGKRFKDKITVAGQPLVLNGLGMREATVFKVNVYVAGLYVTKKSKSDSALLDMPGPKRITLKFVRDVDKDDLTKAWREGFEKNSPTSKKLGPRVAKLNGMMRAMKDGESMSFTFVPGKGTTVRVAGKRKGTIAGDDFGRAMFAIWLGKSPPNAGLKKGLRGL